MGFVGQHPLFGAAAAAALLAADLLGAGELGRHLAGTQGLDLVEQEAAGQKAVEPLLPSSLALHLQAGRAMEQHDTGGGLVHVLAAVPTGPDKGFFDVGFTHAECGHALGELGFFVRADRERFHGRRLAGGRARRNPAARSDGVGRGWTGQPLGETACPGASGRYCGGVKLLFIADIVGQPGRRAVRELVPQLRLQHGLSLVVANGENSAGGSGITVATAEEIFEAGVDIITTGDHLWDQKDVMRLLENERRFVRPLNYPPGTPGQGSAIFQGPGLPPVAILNLQGRTFMPALENPFHAALAEVERLRQITKVIFVDFHAEATSEKVAMARMLDGRVSAVVGTHTHVQTADEQIFPGGTAFLCDGGFTGPHESVIGREIEPVIRRFMTYMPQKFEVAKGRILLQGALVEIDEQTGHAKGIQRVSEPV